MKESKSPCAVAFLLVIALFMCAIGLHTLTRQVLVKRLGMSNAFTSAVLFDAQSLNDKGQTSDTNDDGQASVLNGNGQTSGPQVDWAARYPFPEGYEPPKEEDNAEAAAKGPEQTNAYITAATAVRANVETYTTDFLPLRKNMTELARGYEAATGWDYVPYSEYNGVVTTDDGYLTTVYPRIDVSKQADATIELAKFCESAGIPFAYVSAPFKVCKSDDENLCDATDFTNQNADEFLSLVEAAGVRTLDLREALHREGLQHHELFFRTDHHWLPQTGLWATGEVARLLSEDCDVRTETTCLDPSLFHERTYPNWFLGSQGKKVTLESAKPEDISLLYPDYRTNLHYKIESRGIDVDGDFSVLYDMAQIAERDYYNKNPYAAYIYADQPLESIENRAEGLDGHVLVVHDSFGNAVVPFLAMGVRRTDSIDLRHFDGSLRSYVERERPDAVVMLYNPSMLANGLAFELQ